MNVLVVNCGSSSLKYQLFNMDDGSVMAQGLAERINMDNGILTQKSNGKKLEVNFGTADHAKVIGIVIEALTDKENGPIASMSDIGAVGHRCVHGGEELTGSMIIDDSVIKAMEANISLAPLHNPANLQGIEACMKAMPGVPQVGVFDTAFHSAMPAKAYMYGLPYEMYEKHKVRRYGFHGTSHLYVSQKAAELMQPFYGEMKIITCHLGNGSSITAVKDGKSVDTSMGLTPLEGLVMGTRCGDMDPAIVTFLMEKENLDIKGVDNLLNKKSGVLGLSGVSSDFRDLADAAASGNERAELALEVFAYRVKKYIGAYAAAMGGVDCIVFTAGIGENDIDMRRRILSDMEYLGVDFDEIANDGRGEREISRKGSKVRAFVIPTNEELVIARDTIALVNNLK